MKPSETWRNKAMSESELSIELPLEDKEYLDANHPGWQPLPWDGSKSGVLITDFPLPPGYTADKSDIMIIIPQGYPGTSLDMFYCHPPLSKASGSDIAALASETHFGRPWQRWSRHYNWTPGYDSIVSHLEFVKNTLKKETAQ